VRFLGECQSLGPRVSRRATGTPAYDPSVLRHLPPPAEFPSARACWGPGGADHVHGGRHHRRGPDFITVLDRGERGTAVRLTRDHPGLLGTFLRLLEPTPVAALDPVEREALTLLAAERLVLAGGGWAVTLPPRVRRWPVPCTAI
jgi:hypothetical protein